MRWPSRSVHRSVFDTIQTALSGYGWLTHPGGVGIKTLAVTLLDTRPPEGQEVSLNTVAVVLGRDWPAQEDELGGGLLVQPYEIFVDIFGENASVSTAIADDVVGLFDGSQSEPVVPLADHAVTPPVPAGYLEVDGVFREPQVAPTPERWKANWVSVTLRLSRTIVVA